MLVCIPWNSDDKGNGQINKHFIAVYATSWGMSLLEAYNSEGDKSGSENVYS